jgi:CDP-diacylglycerol--glycerol-3-phosphate 3-phosphatidyltransferase
VLSTAEHLDIGDPGRTADGGRSAAGDHRGVDGLYALKPWYAARLSGVSARIVARRVSPHAVTAAGVGCAFAAGAALAAGVGWLVPPLVAARLAFANLDGSVARASGRATRWGSVVNELGDRAADLGLLAGALPRAPLPLVVAAMLAAVLPSWISLAGAAAGSRRVNGGPMGKTERSVVMSFAAVTGAIVPGLAVIAAGSLLTAGLRLRQVAADLRAPA